MWRQDVVQILGDIRIYPDPDDGFIGEPAVADFQAGTFDFTLITIHSIYGDTEAERRAEAELLDEVYAAVQDAGPYLGVRLRQGESALRGMCAESEVVRAYRCLWRSAVADSS